MKDIIKYLIQAIHLFLVLLIVLSLFIPNQKLKEMVLVILLLVMSKYITGDTKCGLTRLEYLVTGSEYQEGFIYRLITPLLTIPEEYFEKHLFTFHSIWIIVLIYQLYF